VCGTNISNDNESRNCFRLNWTGRPNYRRDPGVLERGIVMKALLLERWSGYQAGQVLTSAVPGEIPPDSAVWYADDEIVPQLRVVEDRIDPALHPEIAARLEAQRNERP
jgi:hypothetical protein